MGVRTDSQMDRTESGALGPNRDAFITFLPHGSGIYVEEGVERL